MGDGHQKMDLDLLPEKYMLGGLGPLSQQIAALPLDVRCEHALGFSFDWRPSVPEIGAARIKWGRPTVSLPTDPVSKRGNLQQVRKLGRPLPQSLPDLPANPGKQPNSHITMPSI